MEDLRRAFGQQVKALRREQGLSQEQLAERASLHWTYISEVERGLRAPSLDVVGRLAAGLDVTVAQLCAGLDRRFLQRFRSSHRSRGR